MGYNCFTEIDRKRLHLITKLLMLSVFSIITSQICYLSLIVAMILRFSGDSDDFNQGVFLLIGLGVLYPAEVVLNFVSMYLTNKFAAKQYDSWCRPCHSCCSGRCVQ